MRRVVTLFEARGAQQVRAALGEIRGGFGSLRQDLGGVGTSSGYVNNQLRALGTTLRYAFAGSAIFGTLQMVRNLGQFQAQLGEISSIATTTGGIPIVGRQLDQLGTDLIDVSNKTTQPIADLQNGVLSLYSTIGDVPPNEAANIMDTISKTAITSQSNVEDTTQALLGMVNAFGESTTAIGKYGDEFYRVIQLSAGMPGAAYAQQLGRLSSSAALGMFSPEQMGALAIGATRFGGSPQTNMNNLAQMMLYLMNPRSKKEQQALAGIGLGPQQRQRLGGWQTLMTLLNEVNRRGGVGMSKNFQTASDEMLQNALDAGLSPQQMGVSGGGASLLETVFGRIQSMRIAAILSRMVTPQQVAGTENKTLDQYLQLVSNSAGQVNEAMGRAMDYRRIVQASNAMHNFGIEVGTALSPFLQYPARGITAIATDFNQQSQYAKFGEVAGGATGVALLLRRLSRGGATGAGTRLLRGGGLTMAAMDTLTGGQQRGDSPLNPIYVAVVYSLSGAGRMTPGIPGYGIPSRDLRTAEGELGAATAARSGKLARVGSRFSGLRSAGGLVGDALMLTTAYELAKNIHLQDIADETQYNKPISSHSLLNYVQHARSGGIHLGLMGAYGSGVQIGGHSIATKGEQAIIDRYRAGQISADEAERRLRRIAPADQLKDLRLQVVGKADVNVTVKNEQGKKIGKTHVTTDLFGNFTTKPAPQTKAKPKTQRGGN